MLISHVLGRGQIAAQHTADVQTAPGILRESQIFYHICSLQSLFPYQRTFFKRFVCNLPPTSPPVYRPWPHVRSPPPSRIVSLERRACSVCRSPSAGRARPLICSSLWTCNQVTCLYLPASECTCAGPAWTLHMFRPEPLFPFCIDAFIRSQVNLWCSSANSKKQLKLLTQNLTSDSHQPIVPSPVWLLEGT